MNIAPIQSEQVILGWLGGWETVQMHSVPSEIPPEQNAPF